MGKMIILIKGIPLRNKLNIRNILLIIIGRGSIGGIIIVSDKVGMEKYLLVMIGFFMILQIGSMTYEYVLGVT